MVGSLLSSQVGSDPLEPACVDQSGAQGIGATFPCSTVDSPLARRRAWRKDGEDAGGGQRRQAHPQHLRLIEQIIYGLGAGWKLQRILRLALRAAVAGVARSTGAHVSVLDSGRNRVTVVDAVGSRAASLKGRDFALADFPCAQDFARGEGKSGHIAVIHHDSATNYMPFVAEGTHLLAAPLLLHGEVAGLLGISRGGQPELGDEEAPLVQLTAGLVAVAIANGRLLSEVTERTREAAVLEELDLRVLHGLPFTRALCVLASAARELTRSSGVSVAALNADGQSQTRLIVLGRVARALRERQIPMRRGIPGWAIEHGEPTFSNDLPSDPRVDAQLAQVFRELSLWSGAIAPMLFNGKFIGCLSVYGRPPQAGPYGRHDTSLLARLAAHALAAIEDACLSNRYRHSPLARTLIWQMLSEQRRGLSKFAIAEERARIARDLHDGLAQHLINLNFGLQSVEQMVADPASYDRDEVQREVAGIREAACAMYDELRACIGELDTRVKWDDDFTRELAKIIEQFAATNGIQACLDLRADCVKLPPLIGLRLLQIVEEALVNIQKHARASQVCVALSFGNQQLELNISDDGCGFQLNSTRLLKDHFGLSMMRERAKEIGAGFSISTRRGHGTSVLVTLPVAVKGG